MECKPLKYKYKPFVIAGAICALCIAFMVAALVYSGAREPAQAEFKPPPFEAAAQAGTPEVPEAM